MTAVTIDPETIRQWVQASCDEQGVPYKIRDPHIIAAVATLWVPNPQQPTKPKEPK